MKHRTFTSLCSTVIKPVGRYQRLRNRFTDTVMKEFKTTVEQQSRAFPGCYYLHSSGNFQEIALTFDDGDT